MDAALLADQMVQLGYIESVSHETVRQTLKKTNSSLGNKIADSPEQNAEFVCQMESVLQVYQRHYHPDFPVICLDEATNNHRNC